MKMPLWLLRLLPMWDYICPKCRREVKPNSHQCPLCGERFPFPLRVPPRVLNDKKALEDYVHKHIFPKISTSQREYLTQFFTTIFSDGFESGNFSAWTGTEASSGNTIAVASDQKHHGSYSAKTTIQQESGWGKYARCYKTLASSYTIIYTRIYIRWSALPTTVGDDGHMRFLQLYQTSGPVWLTSIDVRYDGTDHHLVLVEPPDDSVGGTGTTVLNTNTWYCVELYCKFATGGAGEYKVYLNGALEISHTGLTNNYSANRVYVGDVDDMNPVAHNTWVDCVVVADAYIGPEAAGQLYEIYVDTVSQSLATPAPQCTFNLAKDAAVASQVAPLNFQLDIPKNAVTEVLTLHSEEATYNVIKDAIAQALATALFETGIFKDAISQTTATPNIEIVFTIPKDAILGTLADATIQSILDLSPEAVIKVLAEASVIKEGEVKITKLFLVLGNLAIQIQG
jgi:hypothetical protein